MKRRRKCDQPVLLRDVISRFLKSRGLEKIIKEQEIINEWSHIVGEKIAEYASPAEIKNGILFLKVKNAVWRQQLIFFREDIVSKVNAFSKSKIIHSVHLN